MTADYRDKKISELTALTSPTAATIIPAVLSGSNYQLTLGLLSKAQGVWNVKDAAYGGGAAGDGVTDDTSAIQAAIDDAFTVGGGIVYLPTGTYIVSGTGTPSDGCIIVKSNVKLLGDGLGNTIIKLKDQYTDAASGHKITGIVRTPSGEVTRNTGCEGITIDGNRQKQTFGVTSITFSSTTATVTTDSDHGLSNGDDVAILGASEEVYNDIVEITVTGSDTFTYDLQEVPSSNAVAEISYIAFGVRGVKSLTAVSVSSNVATATISESSSLGSNPISTSSSSTTLTVTLSNHGYERNTLVKISGAATTNGVPDSEINADHAIFNITKDTFQIKVSTSATSTGTGGGSSIVTKSHGLAVGDRPVINGCSEQAINGDIIITAITGETFSWSVTSADGSKTAGLSYAGLHDGFYCGVTPSSNNDSSGNSNSIQKDDNIFFLNGEIKNCTQYGCDPHEQTINFRANNNSFWNNLFDGAVADLLVDSNYDDNRTYLNGRGGLNIVTRSQNVSCNNISSTSNGWHQGTQKGNGLVVQAKSNLITVSNYRSSFDCGQAFRIDDAFDVQANNLNIKRCGKDAVYIEGVSESQVTNVKLRDVCELADNTYDAVRIKDNSGTASDKVSIRNVDALNERANKPRYMIHESPDDATECVYENINAIGFTRDYPYVLDGDRTKFTDLRWSLDTTDGSASDVMRLVLSSDSSCKVNFEGSAWNSTDSTGSWFDIAHGGSNVAGTTSLLGTARSDSSFAGGATAGIAADDGNDRLDFTVTGIASKDIRWEMKFSGEKNN